GIPVIFMTGYSDEETRQKAYTAHPAGYFVKPLDYDKLKEELMSIMHQKK
ncbi:MAG: Response regulator receiver domain, partial [Nitrospirae bacterium]|nr:Response regulator receiver domain [Nitrospirota bacterium]